MVEDEIEVAQGVLLEPLVAGHVCDLEHGGQRHAHGIVPIVELSRAHIQAGRLRRMREVHDLLAGLGVDNAVGSGALEVVENRIQLGFDAGLAGHGVVHSRRERRLRERGLAAAERLRVESGRHNQRRER